MKRVLAAVAFCATLCSLAGAATDPVAEVNSKVAGLEEALRGDGAISLVIKSDGPIEGSPPVIRFNTLSGRLVSANISVGHETWQTQLAVYFYEDGQPMKYIQSKTGRQIKPERQAIIYAPDGRVIWSNVDAPLVDPTEMRSVYRGVEALRRASARY